MVVNPSLNPTMSTSLNAAPVTQPVALVPTAAAKVSYRPIARTRKIRKTP